MIPILTPTESADLDRTAQARGVTVDVLMENAGRHVARTATALAGGAYGRRAVVLAGKGNNGGDGLVAARHLGRAGMAVTVLMLAAPEELRGAAAVNFGRYAEAGGRWAAFTSDGANRELGRADVAVDAIFGTGFRGIPEGPQAGAIAGLNASPVPVVAVDIPSGVEGETGSVRGDAVWAAVTVTFGALKPGIVFHPGAERAGVPVVADIGFPPDLVTTDLWLFEREDARDLVPVRKPETHKRSAGAVLVVAGSRAMTGAALLVAGAAYRAGAGLVTLAVPEGILPVVESSIMEATFVPLPETAEGTVAERAWPVLEGRLGGVGAVAVGPGLTTHPETAALIRWLVAESPTPAVVDADGLNAFEGRAGELAGRRSATVLTPHAGEFGRLAGLAAGEVVQDRVAHARKAAADFDAVVLLKGSRTVVAEPDGRALVNPTGGPYLATGGTGDVLTGAIAAHLAAGLRPADAAILGAYLHGLAGRLARDEVGEGVVASDVTARLGRVTASVLSGPDQEPR